MEGARGDASYMGDTQQAKTVHTAAQTCSKGAVKLPGAPQTDKAKLWQMKRGLNRAKA